MNASIKSSLINPKSSFIHIKSAFFHSTAVLERARRNYWISRSKKSNNNNNNNRRSGHGRNHFKINLKRVTDAYLEYLFPDSSFRKSHNGSGRNSSNNSWFRKPHNESGRNLSNNSWFRKPHNGSGRNSPNTQGCHKKGRRGYSFCEDDDDDVETIFRSAFGDRFIFWSFVNDDCPNWRNSSRYSNNRHKTSWKWRQQNDDDYEYDYKDEYEYTSDDNTKKSDLASERIALGLHASGPLKIIDVKNAYRACALKWHPDRHLGASKGYNVMKRRE